MARAVYALVSIVISIVFLVFVMRFLGVTWSDVDNFVSHSMRNAAKILSLFQGIFSSSPRLL